MPIFLFEIENETLRSDKRLHYLKISKKQILLMDPDQVIALTHRKNH